MQHQDAPSLKLDDRCGSTVDVFGTNVLSKNYYAFIFCRHNYNYKPISSLALCLKTTSFIQTSCFFISMFKIALKPCKLTCNQGPKDGELGEAKGETGRG